MSSSSGTAVVQPGLLKVVPYLYLHFTLTDKELSSTDRHCINNKTVYHTILMLSEVSIKL